MQSIILFLSLFLSLGLHSQNNPTWLRHSALSPDGKVISFTYKGDIYTVPVSGGRATQLTFHTAHDYGAVWSKDGNQIAFASDRHGNFDVFTMPSTGGQAKRITFHSRNEKPFSYGIKNDSVYFGAVRMDDVNHRQFPSGSQPELYAVSIDGGRVNQVSTLPMEHIQLSKSGDSILYMDKKGGENYWRKHHTSSIARDIWLYNVKNKTHKKLTNFAGEDRLPHFADNDTAMYYLSEQSGTFNVYKKSLLNQSTSTQITNFDLHPVRFLSVASGVVSFGYDGELYILDNTENPKKVNVEIVTQNISNPEAFLSINGDVQEMAIAPNGKEIAFISRGEVFVTSVDHEFTKRLTNTPESERFVSWGPEGKSVIYSSERNNNWSIYKTEKVRSEEPFFFAATLLKESPVIENRKDTYLAQYAPNGKKLAYIEDRRTLKIRDLSTNTETVLLTPDDLFHMSDGDKSFSWSPDSNWLLVDWSKTLSNDEVLLLAADGSKRVNLNQSGYYDFGAKWVNKGKQMLWLSNRNGLKSYATSGRSQLDVYSLFFTQDSWDEFNLSEEDFKLKEEIEKLKKEKNEEESVSKVAKKAKQKKDKKSQMAKPLTIDWEGLEDRKKRLTIHSSSLADAVLSKDGKKLYYLARFEDKLNLWSTELRSGDTKIAIKLNASSGSLQWDKDMKNLFLLSGGNISKIDPEKGKKEGIAIQAEMKFNSDAERQAMFDHVWIRTKAIFYHSNFHGVDWDLMKKEYGKHVKHTGNSHEFAELLSEMLGELNVSHAGAGGASNKVSKPDNTASLGVFYDNKFKGNGIRITEILKNGPLDKAKFKIELGDIIQKIDGLPITADKDYAQFLNRKVGKFTLLEITNPETGKTQEITVKPISLGKESNLLYKRWVKNNKNEVEQKSNGTLGYVHLPGMSDGPYRDIYQDMMGKYANAKGMVIDTRFNSGGDLVADLAMFFTGTPFITYETETRVVGGEPTSRWTKPTLALINEAQYSDGHCFACGYTDLKIGKTVGMPVPGTCSFAGWEGLPDGSYWGVVPVSAKDINGNWMENNQTEPTVKIKNMPGTIDNGVDQQLDRAIKELLQELKN